jgi:hypothetical protein
MKNEHIAFPWQAPAKGTVSTPANFNAIPRIADRFDQTGLILARE